MNNKNLALQLMALAACMLTGQNINTVAAVATPNRTTAPRKRSVTTAKRQVVTQPQNFNREPDGVKIIVDRPRRENYCSQASFARDMANYRCLIDQAKKCDNIKTRVPDDVPAHVHNNRRDWYDVNGVAVAPQMPMPQFGCPCECEEEFFDGWGW